MNNTNNEFHKSENSTDDELKTMLDLVINPVHSNHISDWIYFSKPNERKGLYVLFKVAKHKGQKIFKTQFTKTKEEANDISKLTLEEAYKRYQKRQIGSTYSEFYGGNMDDKFKYNNILKYKDFENLNYAEIINKEVIKYIQAWVSIEESEQYKEWVLDFLRSFLATIRSNRKFVTHNHDQFNTFKTKDKFTPHAPFNLTNKKDKLPEKPLTIEELRRRWNLDDLKKYEIQAPSSSEQISNREEILRRKEELSRGSKGLINGIYNSSTLTNYQECYKFSSNKYPSLSNQKEYRSGVKGISPDPLIIARIQRGTEINDDLKNTVKTIMFNDEYNKYR